MGGSVQPAEEQKAPLRAFLLYFLRLARSDLAALSQVRGYGVASFLHSRFTWSSDGNDFSEAPYARVARANKQWSWEYRYQNPTTGKRKSIFLSTKKFPTQVAVERHLEASRKLLLSSQSGVVGANPSTPFLIALPWKSVCLKSSSSVPVTGAMWMES
jgi:hypothetical protein